MALSLHPETSPGGIPCVQRDSLWLADANLSCLQLCVFLPFVSIFEPFFAAVTKIIAGTYKPPSPHPTHNPSPTVRVHVAEDGGGIAALGVDCVPATQNLPFGQQFLAVPGFCANQRDQVERVITCLLTQGAFEPSSTQLALCTAGS